MTTRRLTIEIVIDSRKAKDAVRGLEREVEKFGGTVTRKGTGAVNGLTTALRALGSAAVLAGIYRLGTSFIDAASEAEQYRVRLKSLLGSVEEGNRLFANMADFAARVPFEYRETMAAATQLSAVLKGGVDEVTAWMPLIGDLAAAFGMNIEDTTGQVIRMLSAGAGAADTFRERGVLAMLGFQHGVSYSLEETRRKLIEAWEEPTSKFRGATDDLAKTWAGTTSQLSDAWFQFRATVMEQGLMEHLTEIVESLAELAKNESLQQFAVSAGGALATVVRNLSVLQAAVLNTVADLNEAAASVASGLLVIDKFVSRGKGAQIPGREERIASLRALAAEQRAAAEAALGFAQADSALAAQLKGSIRNFGEGTSSLHDFGGGLNNTAGDADKLTGSLKELADGLKLLKPVDVALLVESARVAAIEAEVKVILDEASMRQTLADINEALADSTDDWLGERAKEVRDQIIAEGKERVTAEQTYVQQIAAIQGEYLEGLQRAFADAFSEIFTSGELNWESFFQRIGDLGGQIIGEAIAAQIAKVLEASGGGIEGLGGLFGNNAMGWASTAALVGGAVSSANNKGYAAAGAAIGAAIGAYAAAAFTGGLGAVAGAQIGAVVGAWIGSQIKTGSPEFFGALTSEMGKVKIGPSEIAHGWKQLAAAFNQDLADAMQSILDTIGATLGEIGPGVDLKLKDDKLSVFIDGMEHRFKEEIGDGIAFALVEALKRADIQGASETFIQILENTTANTMEELKAALDFGEWYERLRLGDTAADLTRKLDEFGVAIRKALEFGLDIGPVNAWLSRSLGDYRNAILGIVETDEERIRREAAAFNQWLQVTEAEQLARKADLLSQKAVLEAEIAIIRGRLAVDESHLHFKREMLDAEVAINAAEWELLHSKLQVLAAVDAALKAVEGILANLPDLISDKEIRDAVNRTRRGTGPDREQQEESRQGIRDEVASWGLSDVSAALHEASQFTEQFEERIKELGFSAQETADLLAAAAEEEARRVEQVRADVRQTYYDAIAQAQGLSEIWGVLDRFRDLRQAVLDAGLSAEETAERMRGIDWAEDVELQRIEIGIVDRLFGYLEGEEDWAERSLEFARMKVELEFGIMQAQLQLLGVFEEYIDIFNAAREAALADLELPDIEPPARDVRNHFEDAAKAAAQIAENFARAKQSVAEFLNSVLVGEFGGTSPTGGVLEAQRQLDEVIRQAMTGNIGAIESFDDYASTLLRLARDAYGSSPEFQAIRDYVLAAGRDILQLQTGREGNLVFDERFHATAESQLSEQRRMVELLARIDRELSRRIGPIVDGKAA